VRINEKFDIIGIDIVEYSDAWVTTSGINNLVNSLVGEALCSDTSEVDVPCIGFCNSKHIGGTVNIDHKRTYQIFCYFSGQDRLQKIPTISTLSSRCIDRFTIMEEEGTTRNSIIQTSSISLTKKIRKSLKIREINNRPCTNFGRHSTNTDSVILLMNFKMSRRFLCLISLLRNLFLAQNKTRLCVSGISSSIFVTQILDRRRYIPIFQLKVEKKNRKIYSNPTVNEF
jgi:hypothetical protein